MPSLSFFPAANTFCSWSKFWNSVLMSVTSKWLILLPGTVNGLALRIATFSAIALPDNSGHLLYARGEEIWAVAFDTERWETRGDSKIVLKDVAVSDRLRAQFDVAEDGTLVYVEGKNRAFFKTIKTLAWIDADDQAQPFTKESGHWQRFDLFPDGRRVVIEMENDIWILEKGTEDHETFRPLILSKSDETKPLWSRDGQWIYFASDLEGVPAI